MNRHKGYLLKTENLAGRGTTVTDIETGEPIRGIRSITATIAVNEPNRLYVEMMITEMEVQGVTVWGVADPRTGDVREVKEIKFADGEKLKF